MRNRTVKKISPEAPDLGKQVQRIESDIAKIKKAKPEKVELIDPTLIDALIQAFDDIHNRPKQIAIEVIRDDNSKITAMIGTTDPDEIKTLRKDNSDLDDWVVPEKAN